MRPPSLCKRCLPLLAALLGCDAFAEPDRAAPQRYEGRGFSATLRKDVSTNSLTPKPDVTLYDLHVGSLPLLFIYVGDRPGFPHFAAAPVSEDSDVLESGLGALCRKQKPAGGQARECLIELSETSPTHLHIWYEKLDATWAKAADRIIASIEPRYQ
ncbi:MAG: hypothetical protein RL701_739 [Pseudomonadota bacterium]